MKKIQNDSIPGYEVTVELDTWSNKMKSRTDENFHTTKLISLLSDVYRNEQFTEAAYLFYDSFLVFRKMK
jgi:hypothetical protein